MKSELPPPDARLLAIANHFAVEDEPVSVSPIGQGLINDSYRLDCKHGAFLLQRLNVRVFPEPALVMDNIQRITRHLIPKLQRRYPSDWERRVLHLIATKDGEPAHTDREGRWWRMFRFLKDGVTYERTPDTKTAYSAAEAFGAFIRDLIDLPNPPLHETIAGFHDTPARLKGLLEAVDEDRFNRARDSSQALHRILRHKQLIHCLSGADLPLRTVHNDTKLNNVIFYKGGSGASCVVDLDTVMPGIALHDFGDLVRSAAAVEENDNVRLDVELFHALRKGWLAGIGESLSDQENELLALSPQVITLELAIRFLTDHLQGDRYFKVRREGQNLERSCRQLGLLASMQAQEQEMLMRAHGPQVSPIKNREAQRE